MFSIELLPAQQGDAIWIEYGDPKSPNRILIDAGTPPTAATIAGRINQLASDQRRFELLVVTHIDTDHIGGVLKLLADRPPGLKFDDVWFNAWRHIDDTRSSRLGPVDGEILSDALDKLKWPWNAAFQGGAVGIDQTGGPKSTTLAGGMQLTVISPGPDQLRKLRSNWCKVTRAAGLDPGQPDRAARLLQKAARKGVAASLLGERAPNVRRLASQPEELDTAVANGSSIALLAEYEGKSVLIGADAFPHVLLSSVQRVLAERGQTQLALDAVKVPHHGSANNISLALLSALRSTNYLISTNGAIFGHPDDEALARIIWANRRSDKRLYFNYPTDRTLPAAKRKGAAVQNEWSAVKWDNRNLQRTHRYEVRFGGAEGTKLDLAG